MQPRYDVVSDGTNERKEIEKKRKGDKINKDRGDKTQKRSSFSSFLSA